MDLKQLLWLNAAGGPSGPKERTITGNPVTFKTKYAEPMTLEIPFSPIQAEGTPSPDNVLPITGFDSCLIFDDPVYNKTIVWNQKAQFLSVSQSNGVTVTENENGSITLTGSSNKSVNGYVKISAADLPTGHKYLILKPGTAHVGNGGSGGGYNYFCRYDGQSTSFKKITTTDEIIVPSTNYTAWELEVQIGYSSIVYDDTFFPQLFDLTVMFGETTANEIYAMEQETAGSGVAWFKNLFPKTPYTFNSGETTCVSAVNGDPCINKTVSFPSTSYGGTLTVNADGTGTLVVDRGFVTLTNVSQLSNFKSNYKTADISIANIKHESNKVMVQASNCLAISYDDRVATDVLNLHRAYSYASGITLRLPSTASASAIGDVFTAFEGGQYVYELSTPVTTSLSPGQVKSIVGVNNVWTNTNGENTVIYIK